MRTLQRVECKEIAGGLIYSSLGGLIAGGLQLNFPATLLSLTAIESFSLVISEWSYPTTPSTAQKYLFGAVLGAAAGSASYWSSFYATQYFTKNK